MTSRIRPARFVHVVYRTRRFEQMIQWYETVFDARVQYQNPVLAFLTYDDEHHRIALINMQAVQPDATEAAPRGKIGVDHVAYTYDTVEDLFENYAQLKEAGIMPYWCIHHGVTVSMYYADPDGNQMELQVDACATTEEANAYMYRPALRREPDWCRIRSGRGPGQDSVRDAGIGIPDTKDRPAGLADPRINRGLNDGFERPALTTESSVGGLAVAATR